MSGGVGPTCNDISLPKEELEQEQKHTLDPLISSNHKKTTSSSELSTTNPRTKPTNFLSFRQLNALAIIIIFSASGLVWPEDCAFSIFSLIYIYFIAKVAFPPLQNPTKEPPIFSPQKNRSLRRYILMGATIGLFLPIAYIFEGIMEGDREGIKAAAPHVFLLASEVFVEGVAFSDRFSTPIRVLVSVYYNARRLFAIMDWLRNEFSKVEEEYGGSERRLLVGQGLALANLGFWSYNLFGFLLPHCVPRAFKHYYSADANNSNKVRSD